MSDIQTLTAGNMTNTGACIGNLPNGKKIFILGALPNEEVTVKTTKMLAKYDEGIVQSVLKPSKYRVPPQDSTYLHTSPWQIMTIDYENELKSSLIIDAYRLSGIDVRVPPVTFTGNEYHYRAKYTFYISPNGELGIKARGDGEIIATDEFSLTKPEIVEAANGIARALKRDNVSPECVHSIIVRSNAEGVTASRLNLIEDLDLLKRFNNGLKAIGELPNIQVATLSKKNRHKSRVIFENGLIMLSDSINGIDFSYGVNSFFQVNVPAYENALLKMREYVSSGNLVDFYSGVGTIGISLGLGVKGAIKNITLVDIDKDNYAFAKDNALAHFGSDALEDGAKGNTKRVKVICASASKALEKITADSTLIVNPARNGLAKEVVQQILTAKPSNVIYLSCNPSTQARDVAKLLGVYEMEHLQGFNFFPKTPHIECLCVLKKS
ncbi:MAG: hypothetical protein LBC50_02400 [Candidatus Ancillula sp.]|jgi:tRNA/tmRNA/rRNA uracil-C5-methylase (TrmA/RlmC/RlmD family)|nr:hypothetical protein [Candidatus Ancillula sp.]